MFRLKPARWRYYVVWYGGMLTTTRFQSVMQYPYFTTSSDSKNQQPVHVFCHFTSVFKLRWQRAPAGNDQERYTASVYVQSFVETAASRSDKQFHRRLQGQPHSAAADVDNSGGGS